MALCDLHFFSKTIGKQVGAYVCVPDDAKPPMATIYLLHGLSDDYTIWLRRTSIERYATQYPFIIVMPDGYRSFYTNHPGGPAYADYIAIELVQNIERIFPAKSARSARGICGLSMGGYGALRLALGYPGVFACAVSHSGAVLNGSRNHPRVGGSQQKPEFLRVFGPKPAGSDHDILALARKVKSRGKLPKLRIDCGAEDGLLQDNRVLHAKLESMRVPHEYAEYPGGHNWQYWDLHVQEALAFHARHLRA